MIFVFLVCGLVFSYMHFSLGPGTKKSDGTDIGSESDIFESEDDGETPPLPPEEQTPPLEPPETPEEEFEDSVFGPDTEEPDETPPIPPGP
jgi:hypothetical protein